MGLLDLANDPTMAMAMGLLNASGPQSRPVSMGQAIGQGFQGMQEAQQNQRRNQFQDVQLQEILQRQKAEQAQMERLSQFAGTLPAEERQAFMIDPKAYITQRMKAQEGYTLTPGAVRYVGDKQVAAAPVERKAPTGMQYDASGALTEIPGYTAMMSKIAAAGRAPAAPRQPQIIQTDTGPMIFEGGQARPIMGPGNVPIRGASGAGGMVKNSPEKKASEARQALPIIEMADKLIGSATGSMIGAGADAVAGAFGFGTKGAQAAAQLKVLEGQLIQNMPRMEGPQSDKDVALYKQSAAAIGDPSVPSSMKKAALQTLREIMERNAEGAIGGATGTWSGPKVIDFNQLGK